MNRSASLAHAHSTRIGAKAFHRDATLSIGWDAHSTRPLSVIIDNFNIMGPESLHLNKKLDVDHFMDLNSPSVT